MSHGLSLIAARQKMIGAALRVISSEMAADEDWAHAADENQYAWEQLSLAARDLAGATDALEAAEKPVGWNRPL